MARSRVDGPVRANEIDDHGGRLDKLLEPKDNLGDGGESAHSRSLCFRGDVDRHELAAILHAEHDGAGDAVGESE